MSTKMTQSELGVLDPGTFAAGDPESPGLLLDAYRYLREHQPVCSQTLTDDSRLLDPISDVRDACSRGVSSLPIELVTA